MLDKRSFSVLSKLCDLCPNGKYAILEEKDLTELFPKGEMDRETLKQNISFLTSRQLVGVKYAERGVYCLCVLPAGLSLLEKSREGKREKAGRVLFPLLFSFLGGFLGSLIAILLSAVMGWRLC